MIPEWVENINNDFKVVDNTNIFLPFSNFNGKSLCSLFTHEIFLGLQKIERIEIMDQINNVQITFIKEIKDDKIKITMEKGLEKVVKEYKLIHTKLMKLIFPYDIKNVDFKQYGLNFFIQDILFKFCYQEEVNAIESNLSKSFLECIPIFKKDEKLRFTWYKYLPLPDTIDVRLRDKILEIYSNLKYEKYTKF